MKINLESEEALTVELTDGSMTVQSAEPLDFSAFHMMAAALGYCTLSVLFAWGESAGLPREGMKVRLEWDFADDPHRVGAIRMTYTWPGLPAERAAAAKRVTALCGVHNTLTHSPSISVEQA